MTFINETLIGQHVRLEPLQEKHIAGLQAAVKDGNLWELMVTSVPHPDQMHPFYLNAMADQETTTASVFATIDQAQNKVVGSSRFLHTDWKHSRTEIGFTFLAKSSQRTVINTEAKLLMLTHAFETLKFNRVGFITDFLNHRSRNAILRLGAKQEGILRSHMVMPDGRVRDSVSFSIIKHEWPGIKQFLNHRINQ